MKKPATAAEKGGGITGPSRADIYREKTPEEHFVQSR
jgi:hypothetical protein